MLLDVRFFSTICVFMLHAKNHGMPNGRSMTSRIANPDAVFFDLGGGRRRCVDPPGREVRVSTVPLASFVIFTHVSFGES